MRKLFWSCAAVAVAAAGTVYLAAKHVDQHPYAVMGQTVRAMCGTEHSQAGESAVPAEPTPAEPSAVGAVEPAHSPVVAIADGSLTGQITVGESTDTPMQSAGSCPADMKKPDSSMTVDAHSLPGYCNEGGSTTPCPQVMPYCSDGDCAPQHMPYAEGECCEPSCPQETKGLWEILMDLFKCQTADDPMTTNPLPMPEGSEPMPGKCQEYDHYRHQHEQYCPYTGRCYPSDPTPSPAVPDTPADKQSEEKVCPMKDKAEEMPPAPKSSAPEEPQGSAQEFQLDTMEFRPSDAGLHLFIPGAL